MSNLLHNYVHGSHVVPFSSLLSSGLWGSRGADLLLEMGQQQYIKQELGLNRQRGGSANKTYIHITKHQ